MTEQPSPSHPSYLESFVFCGLCFTQLKRENDIFYCTAGCPSKVPVSALEELVWKEMGSFLSVSEGRRAAESHLGEKLTASEVRHVFHDLDQFMEFVPIDAKRRFAEALIEKVDVMSAKAVHIHFRL